MAQKNLGVSGQKKLTLFLWENLETSLGLLAYQYRLLNWEVFHCVYIENKNIGYEIKRLDRHYFEFQFFR
jgi:hypothetical protein